MSSFICKHCFSAITTCHFFFRVSFSLWCNKILYVSLSDQTLLDLFSKLTGLYFILNHIIPLDTSLSYYSFIFISWKSQGKGQHSVRPIPLLLHQHPKRMLSQVPIASPWTQPPVIMCPGMLAPALRPLLTAIPLRYVHCCHWVWPSEVSPPNTCTQGLPSLPA